MSMLRVTSMRLPIVVLLTLVLGACAGDDEAARDEPRSTSGSPGPSQDVEPSSGPDVGFGPADYAYTLELSCFCAYGGVPVRVTVEDDHVASAVFAGSGGRGGARAGDAAPEPFELTIDDVIALGETAEAEGADEVEVTWPGRSDHPTEVYVDRFANAMDDEIGYRISEVRAVGGGIGG